MTTTLLRRLASHRLVHFVLLGGLVFAFAPKERDGRVVRIEAARVDRAIRDEQARLGRALGAEEKRHVVQGLVDEELLYREGRRIGLDGNDAIVRARVAESMRRSLADAVPASAIDADELRRESEALAAQAPMRTRLALWFVARDRPDAAHRAEELTTALRSGTDPKSPDHPPIPEEALYTADSLARAAGPEVARVAFETAIGQASDPIASAWGFYVVRPLERRPMDPSEARSAALSSLRAKKAEAEVKRAVERAQRDWEVKVDLPPGEGLSDPRGGSM